MKASEIDIRYDESHQTWVAVAPSRRFCTAFGRTAEEARAMLELAVARWFDADGKPRCGPECGHFEIDDV